MENTMIHQPKVELQEKRERERENNYFFKREYMTKQKIYNIYIYKIREEK